MLLTRNNLIGLYTGYNFAFNKALNTEDERTALHSLLCMETKSVGDGEEYDWLGDLPLVEERGNKPLVAHNLTPSQFRIANLDFDRLISLAKKDIERDRHGLFTGRVMEAGEGTRRTLDNTLARRMVAGFTTLQDYTKTAYFALNKKVNASSDVVFSNKGTKKLSVANYEAALQSISERTDAQGVSLNLGAAATALVVSSKNRSLGKTILENALVGGGNTNPNYQASTLRVWGYLDALAPDAWFLFATDTVRKPWIKQVEVPFRTSMDTDPNSPNVIKNDEFLFKIDGRLNIGPGESLLAWGSTGADAA